MSKYTIEMYYGTNITVTVDEAKSTDEAVEKAKKVVKEQVHILDSRNVDVEDLMFEEVTFVDKK